MNCPREAEIWRAIEARHWPDRCDDELRAHAASCTDCADLVEVATVLSEEHEEMVHAAPVPPSGAAWYRAQLRVRQEAVRSVRRVISVVQVTAIVVALVAVFIIVKPFVPDIRWTLPLMLLPLLITPFALYFVLRED
jgi:predicted anti-sigma-YlaC factor YlaD